MGEYVAIDLGATSGRVVSARLRDGRLELAVVERFANGPSRVDGGWRWDADRLFASSMAGVRAAVAGLSNPISVAVDGWGVDFGLLDADGELVAPPRMYRDVREYGVDAIQSRLTDAELYRMTGVQSLPINTVFQLAAMAREGLLARAETLLMVPDLFVYWMTGDRGTEYTNATTTQLVDVRTGDWNDELLDAAGLPPRILTPLRQPATPVGAVTGTARRLAGDAELTVVRVASHDTASAVAAVPAEPGTFGYVSSGTWSLVGVEAEKPTVTEAARQRGFSNEGGLDGTTCLLKTLTGLWLLEECYAAWSAADPSVQLGRLIEAAAAAGPASSFVDIQDELFLRPGGSVEEKIAEYLRLTGQPQLTSRASVVRCILASLAIGYRLAFDDVEALTGRGVEVVHIVGGGSRNTLLCQLTADACDRPVVAGPAEATSAGNALTQALVQGEVRDLQQLRDISRRSFRTAGYTPAKGGENWAEAARIIRTSSGQNG